MTPTQRNRRAFLKGAGVAACAIGMPFVRRAAASERTLRVSTFGGNFKTSFINHICPEFERATGIKIEIVSAQGGLTNVSETMRSGNPPADLITATQEDVVRGADARAWRAFDISRMSSLAIDPRFVHQSDGEIDAIGALAWYQTLVINPHEIPQRPASWKILWDTSRPAWGVASGSRSALFEITAATWFGGTDILRDEDGIRQVVAKIAELKPGVKLWWTSESSMQTAFEGGQVIGGTYFHDVAGLMARDGTEIVSIFPTEGAVIDFASWCQPVASTKIGEAQEFIDFICTPSVQTMIMRSMGTAPLLSRRLLDLTDAEFQALASDRPPIPMAVRSRIRSLAFMDQQFARMLTA